MGKFYWNPIINQHVIPCIEVPKREGMPFSKMIKLKLEYVE